jgi:hypothetical protein
MYQVSALDLLVITLTNNTEPPGEKNTSSVTKTVVYCFKTLSKVWMRGDTEAK